MYVLLAERRIPLLKTTHVLYGPYASQEEAEAAKTKLASLLEPYGDTSFAVKELIPSVLGVESADTAAPHVCPPPVMVPYPWPYPYLPPALPPQWVSNWTHYNQSYILPVSVNTGLTVGLVTGA